VDETTPTTQATLELLVDHESEGAAPAGAPPTLDGCRRAFTGWIELACAIEAWRQAEERDEGLRDGH
jgi:hypothetical protein